MGGRSGEKVNRDRTRAIVRELVLIEVIYLTNFEIKENELYIEGNKVLRAWESLTRCLVLLTSKKVA
jgi:hypothetical protein